MNPNLCRMVLRPRGPLEVFDLGVRWVAVNRRAIGWLTAGLVLPVWLVLTVAVALWPASGPWCAVLAVVLGTPLQVPFTLLGGQLLFRDDVSVREVVRSWASRQASAWVRCVRLTPV